MKSIIKYKKGSHVGVIASFSIFVMFLVGIYLIMEPSFKVQKDKELTLEKLKNELKQEFSSNLSKTIISNCSGYLGFVDLKKIDDGPLLNHLVKDKNNNIITSDKGGDTLFIESQTESVLWIYSSTMDLTAATGVGGATINNPKIESIKQTQEIFEQKIIDGVNNFANLKSKLDIPQGSEFSFSFELFNGTTINAGYQATFEEVYSISISIKYIDINANILPGTLTINTW